MKQTALFLLMTIAFADAYAQKLPNKQEGGLRAPANVKIDGKATEWGAELQAYNNATELFYTLANDEQNLYLIIQTKKRGIVDKVFSGGMSLFLDNVNNADKNARAVISYSAIAKANRGDVNKAFYDTSANKVNLTNRALATSLKTIRVKNLDGITEDVISVYNEYGITAAGYFTDRDTYSCELAIPLKNLKSFINSKSTLNYTLQVNAMPVNSMKIRVNNVEVDDNTASPAAMEFVNMMVKEGWKNENGISVRDLMTDTNVSGEYILAK
jgi:hypothetical protein